MKTLRWTLFFFLVLLFCTPWRAPLSQEAVQMSCFAFSTTVPPGGTARLLSPIENLEEVGARQRDTLDSETLGHPYEGAQRYDWKWFREYEEGDESRRFQYQVSGRYGGVILKSVAAEALPPPENPRARAALEFFGLGDIDFHKRYGVFLKLPEGVWGDEGTPPDPEPSMFDSEDSPFPPKFPALCPAYASVGHVRGRPENRRAMQSNREDFIDLLALSGKRPPDDFRGEQGQRAQHELFDNRNLLCIDRITTTHDWEDATMPQGQQYVEGSENMSEEERIQARILVTESGLMGNPALGGSGMYSNFHFVVTPCKPEYEALHQRLVAGLEGDTTPVGEASYLLQATNPNYQRDYPVMYDGYLARQKLFHLIHWKFGMHPAPDGSNAEGPRDANLVAPIWVHGMLPGPFDNGNNECAWGDARYQHPPNANGFRDPFRGVTVNYQNFCIWDFDWNQQLQLNGYDNQCAMVFVYDGDGSMGTRLLRAGYIGPNDVIDDFVGLFKIQRNEIAGGQPRILSNFTGNMTITFSHKDQSLAAPGAQP